jgi:ABC-type bacteriocin/lantibiotic exporter with double-glycine peptidase domain
MNTIQTIRDMFTRRWPFVILGLIAILNIIGVIAVDAYGVALLSLAFLPVFLPLLATHFDTFKIGKDGVEGKMKANNEGKVLSSPEKINLIASNE